MTKCILLCIIILFSVTMGRLYEDVFLRLPADSKELGWVAWGIISEAIIIIYCAVKLITG